MAQIDLRNALVEIIDGFALSGTIGGVVGGYAIGTLVMAIDGVNQAIPNGSTFIYNATTHTISSSVGGATPTSITFSPGLSASIADNATITFLLVGPLVNNVAGGSIGDASVTVDGYTTTIPNGRTFKFAGHATVYTVSSTVGGTTPTQINFTPTLTATIADDEQITLFLPGTINHPNTAPVDGATSVFVSGFSVAIPNGMTFTVNGDPFLYTVIGTTGGSTPSAIQFTPPFSTAEGVPAPGNAIIVGPHALEVKIGEGTLTFNEKRNMEYVHNRRRIAFVRTGDDDPMDVAFDFIWEFLKSASGDPITIEEAVKGTPNAVTAGWVTAGADPCEPYAVHIRITYTPPCPNVDIEVITLQEYRWEGGNHDLKAGTVASTGKCKISEADLQRIAQAA